MRNRGFLTYVILLGSGSAAVALSQIPTAARCAYSWPLAAAWLGLSIFLAIVPFRRITGFETPSLSPLLLVTMLLLYGTGATVVAGWLTGIAAALSLSAGRPRWQLRRLLLDSGKHIPGLLVAGLALWGTDLHLGSIDRGLGAMTLARLFVGYGSYIVCTEAVLSTGRRLQDGKDILSTLGTHLRRKRLQALLIPVSAYMLGLAYLHGGALFIAMFAVLAVTRILTVHDRARINTSFAHLVDALRFVRVGDMTQLTGETERELKMVTALARKMRLPRRNRILLEQAAMLHNIGYIAADRKTVLTPTRLTPDEINALKQHPYNGMTMLKRVDGMEGVGYIIYCHHESLDGTGYPRAISGAEIPLESAIIKVAEAFVAMTSPRLYRKKPLDDNTALNEIADAAGSYFDPLVTYHLFEMMGRRDLASRVSCEFGSPSREAVEARLYRLKVKTARVLLPGEKRRALIWGSCLTAAAFIGGFILTRLQPVACLGLHSNFITGSFSNIGLLLALLALSTLRPVRLLWGASLTWAPLLVLAGALAGGPTFAAVFGLGFVGWSMLVNPTDAFSAGGYATGRGDLAERNMRPLARRPVTRSPLQPAVGYGLMLMLAGTGAWLAHRFATTVSARVALGWLPSEVLALSLAAGGFYIIETIVQPVMLRTSGLSSWRLWQRDYLKVFPEPLSYAAFGYAIFLATNLLGLWAIIPVFLLPAVWRHHILRRRISLQRVSESLVRAVARTVDEKDLYTSGHSANVAEVAAEIAREMGKSESFVELLEDAAIRHDLGKVSWPNQVLRKPASLDDDKQELYKWTHPDVGAEIAVLSGSSPEVRDIIRCHHEHFDGGGYLRGLSADEIPIGARILALANTFDAMIHHRSRRERLSIADAITEIRSRAGSQLDPQVVDAFLRILKRINLEELALRVELDMLERPQPATPAGQPDRDQTLEFAGWGQS